MPSLPTPTPVRRQGVSFPPPDGCAPEAHTLGPTPPIPAGCARKVRAAGQISPPPHPAGFARGSCSAGLPTSSPSGVSPLLTLWYRLSFPFDLSRTDSLSAAPAPVIFNRGLYHAQVLQRRITLSSRPFHYPSYTLTPMSSFQYDNYYPSPHLIT